MSIAIIILAAIVAEAAGVHLPMEVTVFASIWAFAFDFTQIARNIRTLTD